MSDEKRMDREAVQGRKILSKRFLSRAAAVILVLGLLAGAGWLLAGNGAAGGFAGGKNVDFHSYILNYILGIKKLDRREDDKSYGAI